MMLFNRIYWRIFFSFWIAIITITFATVYVVINTLQTADFLQRHQETVAALAKDIIERYEAAGEALPSPLEPLKIRRFDPSHSPLRPLRNMPPQERERFHSPGFNITGQDGTTIFQHRFNFQKNGPILQFELNSSTGRTYRVQTFKPPLPAFFKTAIKRFFSVHLILILIVSTLVSASLSWSLTRPLKLLGQFSRRYAEENDKTPIAKNLLARGDEIGDLAIDMYFMTGKIEASLTAQQQLLYDVSHELRAPLARLQASAALIEQTLSSTQHTDRIHSECDRINNLIQQILDYSRLNRDTEALVSIEIVAFLKNLIDTIQFEYTNRHFIFTPSVDTLTVTALPRALASALDNILRNACKYSPKERPVEIEVIQKSDTLSIIIRDHGAGVNDYELEKLLMPFYRSGNRMHTEGFGLGLSIAKQAMDKHHGQLILSNHAEGGLRVECKLPIKTK